MNTSTPTTTKNRLSRLKKGKTQSSPLIKMSSKTIPSEPAKTPNIDTKYNHPIDDPHIEQEISTEQQSYRNYDMYTSSPCYIPNSQAPMPDREVFWDLDTPQTRKYREKLRKQIESISTPESEKRGQKSVAAATPKLELAVSMKGVTRSQEQLELDLRGEEALAELMELCRAQEEGEESVSIKDERVNDTDIGQDNMSMASDMFSSEISFTSPCEPHGSEKAVVPMNETLDVETLGESFNNLSKFDDKDAFNDGCDAFDDDDDSFLIHASQAVDKSIPVAPVNKAVSKLKVEDKEDGFGSDNDSFDFFMSQMDDSSKVIDQEEKQKKIIKEEANVKPVKLKVSDKQLDQGIELNTNTSPVLKRRKKDLNLGVPLAKADNSPVQSAERNAKSIMKKYSSFDNGLSSQQAVEEKKSSRFQRVKSSPVISKDQINQGHKVNTVLSSNSININSNNSKEISSANPKEDIKALLERKKREALAKRAISLSQKQSR